MTKIRHIIIVLSLLLFWQSAILAQTIRVSAPSHVAGGENFRVAYTVNTQDVDEFRAGTFPSGLEVLAGPYTSSQSSFQMVNGHTSSSSSITYTYTVFAERSGTYTIPAAHARIGGRRVASRPVRITVSGNAQTSQQGSRARMHQNDGAVQPQMRAAGQPIRGNDLFIRVSANKKRVHEQEPVLLTYTVYTRVDLTQLEGKMPDLNGFHTQEVKLPQQKVFRTEVVNGVAYKTVTWSQYVMYPQMTGKLTIPPLKFNGIVVEENRSVDPFEAFFNGGSGYVEVKRTITAPGVTIQVDPLPARPAGFSGGVGRFNISSSLNKQTVHAGDPVTLRVVVGGTGNLKLIKQPVPTFPKDFDKYDPKITDKTKLTSAGVEGNMIYDFMVVPRHEGTFVIPPVKLIYYDVNANAYKTISTKPLKLSVSKGDGSSSSDADYSSMSDIRPIKNGDFTVSERGGSFYGSAAYWILLVLTVAAFAVLLVVFRNKAMENANVKLSRSNRANKVASKRLKKAARLMLSGRQSEFYDEVLRALWGYAGDKLSMPVESLSKENISNNLSSHGIDAKTISKFIEALDECEYERYAPGDAKGNMNKTFESAMTAIMEIENTLMLLRREKKKMKSDGQRTIVILLFVLLSIPAFSVTKQQADAEYANQRYQQAIADYNLLLKKGQSAEIYYNLGNAYYRTDNIARAILCYERALRLKPGDRDIRYNLRFVRSKTIDNITPAQTMFFVTWYNSVVNMTTAGTWAAWSLVAVIVALAFFLLYLFSKKLSVRKVGFFGFIASFALFLLLTLFAWQQHSWACNPDGAVVMKSSLPVKEIPSAGSKDVFVIHEGTHVDITDKTMQSWRQIKLQDGRQGWVSTNGIEQI